MSEPKEIRWWDTSLPMTIMGLSGEPFVLVVLIPLFPFGPFISFIGWCLLVNLLISWGFRKGFMQFLFYLKREFFNNRRRIYSARYSKRRFQGY